MGICGSSNTGNKSVSSNQTKRNDSSYSPTKTNNVRGGNNNNNNNNINQNQKQNHNSHQKMNKYPPGKTILIKRQHNHNKLKEDLKQPVELFLSIRNNQNINSGFKVEIMICNDNSGNFNNLAQTDFSNIGLEYDYPTSIGTDYYFEKNQHLRIQITSEDNSLIIPIETKLGYIMGSRGNKGIFNFDQVSLCILGKSIENDKTDCNILIKCPSGIGSLNNGTTDRYYYIISNYNDNTNFRKVYKSEEKSENQDYDFFSIPTSILCLGNMANQVKVEFYDISSQKIGESVFALNQAVDNGCFMIGNVSVPIKVDLVHQKNFVDLLYNGLQISLVVGIDFTASNGPHTNPKSLHYVNYNDNSYLNQYERAMKSCGSILAYYDYDQQYPLLGYGGIPEGGSLVEHVFPLNYNQNNPNVNGIEEMLNVYRQSIIKTKLYGPTKFAPLIQNTSRIVKSQGDSRTYTILLIVTDGIITDMPDTISAIIEASYLPISIVIIGVGAENFDNMETLDGDDIPLSNDKGIVNRDIVQFVEFRKFESNNERLSEEVLKEIPKQVEEYYRNNK